MTSSTLEPDTSVMLEVQGWAVVVMVWLVLWSGGEICAWFDKLTTSGCVPRAGGAGGDDMNGAGDGIRTHDFLLGKQTLYH